MTHSELVIQIKTFKERFNDTETTETMLMYKQMNLTQQQINNAKNLLLSGIDLYQRQNDYYGAVDNISESITILPSAACYYNRGTIHWCEKNYYESFKDQCSSLILNKENYLRSAAVPT
jgi:hypothetical protein